MWDKGVSLCIARVLPEKLGFLTCRRRLLLHRPALAVLLHYELSLVLQVLDLAGVEQAAALC